MHIKMVQSCSDGHSFVYIFDKDELLEQNCICLHLFVKREGEGGRKGGGEGGRERKRITNMIDYVEI